MIYRDLKELMAGFFDFIDSVGGVENAKEHPGLAEFQRLARVYFDAEKRPPDGVIGVGVITYAEHMLQKAQTTMDKGE